MNTIQVKANICSAVTERSSNKGVFHTFNIVEPLPYGNVQYYSCVCYKNELIESLKNINKGDSALILGELKLNKYKKNDVEHTAVNIVVGNVLPLDEFGGVKPAVSVDEVETDDDLPF